MIVALAEARIAFFFIEFGLSELGFPLKGPLPIGRIPQPI